MSKRIRKIIGITLALVMMFVMLNGAFATEVHAASEEDDKEYTASAAEEILQGFDEQKARIRIENKDESIKKEKLYDLCIDTVCRLSNEGYEAYFINSETYDEIASKLNTDLTVLGLCRDNMYVAVLQTMGIDNDGMCYSTVGVTFSYLGNLLRYLTISAADDAQMGKASTVNVLSSKVLSVIQNCLDTAIYAVISSVSNTLGTVASICGLSVSNFGTSQTSTLYLNGGTNWTRTYTQVWSVSMSTWVSGAYVEYANAFSYMSDTYYNAAMNSYTSVPQNSRSTTKYSSQYSNYTWRNEMAINNYASFIIEPDRVGNVQYKYGGGVKITHNENF